MRKYFEWLGRRKETRGKTEKEGPVSVLPQRQTEGRILSRREWVMVFNASEMSVKSRSKNVHWISSHGDY